MVPKLQERLDIQISITGKSYGPTEMVIRGLPGWLADPLPPGKYWRPASAAAGFNIHSAWQYVLLCTTTS